MKKLIITGVHHDTARKRSFVYVRWEDDPEKNLGLVVPFGCSLEDLQAEAANLVFSGALPVEALISHRLPLVKIASGFDMALHPDEQSLKIIVQPQRCS